MRCPAAILATMLLAAPAAAADPCDDLPEAPGPAWTVIHTPEDAAAWAGKGPVLAWIEPVAGASRADIPAWPAAALAGLKLAPRSVVKYIRIEGANLAGWSAPGVVFASVEAKGAQLKGASLAGACFQFGDVSGGDFSGAHLAGATFRNTDLRGARFDRADLSGATLDCEWGLVGMGCWADGKGPMSFLGAKLPGADIAGPLGFFDGRLDGAELDGAALILSDKLFEWLKATRYRSIRLLPPEDQQGKADTFTAAELDRIRKASHGKPLSLLRTIGARPSFPCPDKGAGIVETEMCGSQAGDLPALDTLADLTYRRVLRAAGGTGEARVRQAQDDFLKKRDSCADGPRTDVRHCLDAVYKARLGTLGRALAPTMRAAGKRQLYDLPVVVGPAARRDPLAHRLLKVLGTSPITAILEKRGGEMWLEAFSLGANGDLCAFSGPVHWNDTQGAWVGHEKSIEAAISWLILPDGIVLAADNRQAQEYCGARAGWPAIYLDLPVDDEAPKPKPPAAVKR